MTEKTKKIILYGHPTCPMMYPVMGMLKQAKVDYEYINIHEDMTAREHVREINNGNESVPTLVFPDDTTLTEPGESELRRKLQSMGYDVPFTAMIAGKAPQIITFLVIVVTLLRIFNVF